MFFRRSQICFTDINCLYAVTRQMAIANKRLVGYRFLCVFRPKSVRIAVCFIQIIYVHPLYSLSAICTSNSVYSCCFFIMILLSTLIKAANSRLGATNSSSSVIRRWQENRWLVYILHARARTVECLLDLHYSCRYLNDFRRFNVHTSLPYFN